MRIFAFLISLAFMLGSAAAPAYALSTYILSQAHSPVLIQKCYAGTQDSSVGNKDYYLDFAGIFQNKTRKDIDAVRYRFDVFNTFSEHQRTVFGNDEDTLSAYGIIDDAKHDTNEEQVMANSGNGFTIYKPAWEFININETARDIVCSIDTVKFMDGTIWHDTGATAARIQAALKGPFNAEPYIFSTHSD
jgi:hypothetical protein